MQNQANQQAVFSQAEVNINIYKVHTVSYTNTKHNHGNTHDKNNALNINLIT